MYTPFKFDVINNTDHMRIAGTEPSLVVLSPRKLFQKLERDVTKVQKQAEAKTINDLDFVTAIYFPILHKHRHVSISYVHYI